MTAWNQIVGALIVAGHTEQAAVNMVWDVLHEEAARISNLPVPSEVQYMLPGEAWIDARDRLVGELDPDDPNWSARCSYCYQPWQQDHLCKQQWIDWLDENDDVLAMRIAQATVDMMLKDIGYQETVDVKHPFWQGELRSGKKAVETLRQALTETKEEHLGKQVDDTDMTEADIDTAMETGEPVDLDRLSPAARRLMTYVNEHPEMYSAAEANQLLRIVMGNETDIDWMEAFKGFQ